MEHILLSIKYLIAVIIPDVPAEVEEQIKREEFLVDKVCAFFYKLLSCSFLPNLPSCPLTHIPFSANFPPMPSAQPPLSGCTIFFLVLFYWPLLNALLLFQTRWLQVVNNLADDVEDEEYETVEMIDLSVKLTDLVPSMDRETIKEANE